MKRIKEELRQIDCIMELLVNREGFYMNEIDLKTSGKFNNERIEYLINEGLIYKTTIPISYKLTQKGIVFISGGGYVSEFNRKSLDRGSNLFNLLLSPSLSFLSFIVALFALYYSIIYEKSNSDPKLNFNSSFHLSFENQKDTTIKINDNIMKDKQEKPNDNNKIISKLEVTNHN